jgi:hypothetical protein
MRIINTTKIMSNGTVLMQHKLVTKRQPSTNQSVQLKNVLQGSICSHAIYFNVQIGIHHQMAIARLKYMKSTMVKMFAGKSKEIFRVLYIPTIKSMTMAQL